MASNRTSHGVICMIESLGKLLDSIKGEECHLYNWQEEAMGECSCRCICAAITRKPSRRTSDEKVAIDSCIQIATRMQKCESRRLRKVVDAILKGAYKKAYDYAIVAWWAFGGPHNVSGEPECAAARHLFDYLETIAWKRGYESPEARETWPTKTYPRFY